MQERLKKNCYYISCILLIILFIVLFRLIKIYDILCTVLGLTLPVLFGYIFAWALAPLYKKWSSSLGDRLAVGLLVLITVLIYALLIWYLLPILVENSQNLFDSLEEITSHLSELPYLQGLKEYSHIDAEVLISSCSSLIGFAGTFGLIHIFGFYILYSYDRINAFLRHLIPLKYRRMTLEYLRKLSRQLHCYLKGTILDTAILFALSTVLYWAIGLKYPLILALFSAITNIIPFIGPYIGGIPAVLVGLAGSLKLGLITLGVIVFAQTLESNFINPLIMSKCIKVNPLLIIISLMVMGKFFGLIGMIFAVPTIVITKLTIEFIQKYRERLDEEKSVP